MTLPGSYNRALNRPAILSVAFVILVVLAGLMSFVCVKTSAQGKGDGSQIQDNITVIAPGSAYRQTNFVSDWPGVGFVQDPLLVNPWGITVRGTSPFWVANNGTSTSTLYRGDTGVPPAPVVKNPGLAGITIPDGLPTGAVGNSTVDFVVTSGMASGAANFIFSSITGNISGWNANVPAPGSTQAIQMASHPGHVYTGLAIGNNAGGNRLYAADFDNNHIDVFDGTFALTTVTGGFVDATIPAGYHPFNIQNLGGSLYVTYAKVGLGGKDEEGVGNGLVRKFNTDGVRDLTFAINNGGLSQLNSPWGLAIASGAFGIFSNALIVGNFGAGNPSLHAYNPTTGAFLGTLQDESGHGIVIDELWALIFGNGGSGGDVNTLYFSAGIGEEEHGLLGSLKPTTASATSLIQFSSDDLTINEGAGHIDVTVTRAGDISNPASINYATFDQSQVGHASQKSDYELGVGRLNFAVGESSKTFRILIVNDLDVEGNEIVDLILSNPNGTGLGLGSPNVVELTIVDNDGAPPATNPIDNATFFVRQNYLDYFNREPDPAGLASISNQIIACGATAKCIYAKRTEASTLFLTSEEFAQTGFLAYLVHQAAFGARPLYGQFELNTQALERGLVSGDPNFDDQLEANTQAFFNEFVTRPEYVTKYPSTLTNTQYVDNLLASAGLSPSQVRLFVINLTNSQENPPVVPTSSNGGARPASFGTARLQFNDAQTAMTFTSTVNNIDFTGSQSPAEANDNLTDAHIHAGPAVTPATNGPVVWGFFGTPFNDDNPNDQVVTPHSVGVGGTISGKWDAPEGNGTTLAAQLSNLREGRAYVNFHSTQFPGGEIRGNIPAASSLRDQLIAGLDAMTETRATVLRRVAEQEELRLREFNNATVAIGYFVYLRRDPDTARFNHMVNRLNSFPGDVSKETVRILINSGEYRGRFREVPPPPLIQNTPPDAVADAAVTDVDTPVTINVLANDTDFENEPFLTVLSVTPGVGGTPTIVGNQVLFTPSPGFSGAASFQYTVSDNGTRDFSDINTVVLGLSDPKTDTATVSVIVGPHNNPPVNNVPGAQATNLNTPLVFSGATQISISDPDVGSADLQVTLTATNGTITLNSVTGLSFTVGDGAADPVMTFTGSLTNINAALNGLAFNPNLGFLGAASLQISSNDQGNTGPGGPQSDTDLISITVGQSVVQLNAASFTVGEEDPHATITITRSGLINSPGSVDFVTSDVSGLANCDVVSGNASQRCDYTTVGGKLNFLAGQVSASFTIPIINDVYVEGSETFTVTLSHPSGVALGPQTSAVVTILDNDIVTGAPNPIANNLFFLNQHYLDFLGREPDVPGLQGWIDILNNCGGSVPPPCDRIEVSSAFFRSAEFQERGYFIYRFYAAALGRKPTYNEFISDMARISGFLTNSDLEAAKVAFVQEFMTRPEFTTKYDPTIGNPTAYITLLEQTAGVTLANRDQLINDLTNNVITRAEALRAVIESVEVTVKFYNEGFVVEAYFGYLRRDPDALYLQWLQLLNQTGDYRVLVNGFVNSLEYRQRFGT